MQLGTDRPDACARHGRPLAPDTAAINPSVAGSERQTTAFAESTRQTSVAAAVIASPGRVMHHLPCRRVMRAAGFSAVSATALAQPTDEPSDHANAANRNAMITPMLTST
jgi:hypothetical protein